MRLGGRLEAAIDVIKEVEGRKRPISEALKDWGTSHRFAGSGDRAAIGNLVYDVFRKRRSLAWLMDDDRGPARVHAALFTDWGYTPEKLKAELEGDKFAPPALSEKALSAFRSRVITDAPEAVQADLPDWLAAIFAENFEEEWIAEGRGFAERPPLDIRVNTVKSDRDTVERALSGFKPKKSLIARQGLRIKAGKGPSRLPNLVVEEGYIKGWFEIQDEGSQIAADLVFAQPGEAVLDYCAGAGGKTLALSASMNNKGKIHAFDSDKHRLAAIYDRVVRAGCGNIDVHAPAGESGVEPLLPLIGRMDRVVVDAPCSGSGTWRRHPEAKWKLSPKAVAKRVEEQAAVLEEAALYVRPGGYLIYITCSVLKAENEDQILAFAEMNADFEIVSVGEVWQDLFGFDKPKPWSSDLNSVTLTPASTGTDGFFVAVLWRAD